MYDLHTHTTCSDGATPPSRLPALAKEQGLTGVAVTDHDTMRGVEAARIAAAEAGVRLLPGAELSAFDPDTGGRVHLLVYAPARAEALEGCFLRVSQSRERACLRSLELLKSRYPVTEADARKYGADSVTLFRTHILRALMERGYADRVFGKLYEELFGRNIGFAYVPVEYVPMEEAARAAREAGGVVSLAHPGVYDSFEAARRLAELHLLDGIETSYPRRRRGDEEKANAIAQRFSLLTTGGSDFHGFHSSPPHPLGTCGTEDTTVLKILELAEKRK